MSIATLLKRISNIEFVVAPPQDGDREKFFMVNVSELWEHWEREFYWSFEDGLNYEANDLNELQAAGDLVLVYCNEAHCDLDEVKSGTFDPSGDCDHWLEWRAYTPGTLLQTVKQNHPERIKKLDPNAPLHWSYVDPAARTAEIERQVKFLAEIEQQHRVWSELMKKQGANS